MFPRTLIMFFVRTAVALLIGVPVMAGAAELAEPTSATFCQTVQKILASTGIESTNTIFDNMPDYRASKPSPDPLMTYQVVTYAGDLPIMVSCKIKGAAHLRSAYGEDAAGEQQYCPEITRRMLAQAVVELRAENRDAAFMKAGSFIVENNEPYLTGREYLSDFELSFLGDDGAVHLNSPGLFHDYDSWTTILLPERFEGQSYCHLPTVAYIKGLATGEIEPGTLITTADDAPTTLERD